MSLRILSSAVVERISESMSPLGLQCLMAEVFHAVSRGGRHVQNRVNGDPGARNPGSVPQIPQRTSVTTDKYTALFMPAHLPGQTASLSEDLLGRGTSVKIVSVPHDSNSRGLPGTTLVLDDADGSVKAVVNARSLTALRNAAGSLLSTCLVAKRYPRHIVAFGAGSQILSHIKQHIQFFPRVERCTIINRSLNQRVESLVDRLSKAFPGVVFAALASDKAEDEDAPKLSATNVSAHEGIQTAVTSADLIVCATSSTEPLFPSGWVRSGTHVILIGSYKPHMQEIDTPLVLRSQLAQGKLVVDSKEACFKEAGELIKAKLGADQVMEIGELLPSDDDVDSELVIGTLKEFLAARDGELLKGDGRDDTEGEIFVGPVTIFKSVGIGLQDVAIAAAVVAKAEELGVGLLVDDYDT